MSIDFTELDPKFYESPDAINRLNQVLRTIANNISGDAEAVRVFNGYGSPEGVVAAGIGSMYMRVDGTTNTAIYVKESGTGNTGWIANVNVTLPLSVANGGTGADNSSQVQGTIPYVSGTGVISFLATGTAGQFLKTNGAAANPAWTTVPQAFTLLSSGSGTSSSDTGRIVLEASKEYYFTFRCHPADVNNPQIRLRFYNSGTVLSGATDYAWATDRKTFSTTPASTITGDNADTLIPLCGTAAEVLGAGGNNGFLWCEAFISTYKRTTIHSAFIRMRNIYGDNTPSSRTVTTEAMVVGNYTINGVGIDEYSGGGSVSSINYEWKLYEIAQS